MHVIQLSNDKQKETHRRVASRVEKCKVPVIFNNIAPHLIDLRVFGWLITWTRGAAKSVDVNRSAELQLPRSHSVEQPALRDDSLSLNKFSRQLKAYLIGQ